MKTLSIAVVIPTHCPKFDILRKTLDALSSQSLPLEQWELILVDNASLDPLSEDWISWHPHGKLIREDKLGLTHARIRAMKEIKADILVWVDDDNLLQHDYLINALQAFEQNPKLGAAGGRSIPDYVEAPPSWYKPGLAPIGCCDHGNNEVLMHWRSAATRTYPDQAPIGAGMVTRLTAIQIWADAVSQDSRRASLGRTGKVLTSGEDNDINLTLLGAGWDLAYLPQLSLTHIIPPRRLTLDYQKKIGRAAFRDFIKVLDIHGIRPWSPIPSWSIPLRAVKSYITERAWRGPAEKIRWQSYIGQFEGRSQISAKP